jgi:hypothetical protein
VAAANAGDSEQGTENLLDNLIEFFGPPVCRVLSTNNGCKLGFVP